MLSRLVRFAPLVCLPLLLTVSRGAEPLSKTYPIDFYRDVPSRSLKGLATRSDGRLVSGPLLTDLNGPALPQLVWCLEPAGEHRWLIGTGPEGKIVEVTLDRGATSYTVNEVARLDQPQVLALKRLPDGSLLAGTSPNGVLALVREGKVVAQVSLPADSIFDLALRGDQAFVATGNPARVYQVDLRTFAASGVGAAHANSVADLKPKGISIFGEIRDRNVRRLAWLGDHLIAGSSPKGNIYRFPAGGGAPELLQENRDAEVAALLPQPHGDLFAALVFTTTQGETRINRPTTGRPDSAPAELPAPSTLDRFAGRSAVVYFPKDGFPETLVSRSGLAFYALARRNDTLIIAGGEQGDVLGYDLVAGQNLSFSGSDSAQVNALLPIDAPADGAHARQFLALRNNVSGLCVLDFSGNGTRSAETKRLDLGVPSSLGELRIAELRDVAADQIKVDVRTNFGSDEIEGWSPWLPTERRADGWIAPNARGRNVKLRIELTNTAGATPELDDAALFYLPQDRRPQLAEFRIAPPNYALVPPGESVPLISTLGQLLGNSDRDDKRKNSLLNSSVVPQPGNQFVMWLVSDPDNDVVTCTFSIRREGSPDWIDLVTGTKDSYIQFNTSHLEDGHYQTRLVATEQAPRPPAERLTSTFDTEELVIDNTPPEISEASAQRDGDTLKITVSGHDALSLLEGAEFVFNNGYKETVVQPADGIRDSQSETFILQAPVAKTAGATAVEIQLYDAAGNSSGKRLSLPQ